MKTKDRIIEVYDEMLGKKRTAYHDRVISGLNRIHWSASHRVLNLGCGCGVLATWMARRGVSVTAIDFSPKRIEYAKVHSKNRNITYICEDILEYRDKSKYDVITLVDVVSKVDPSKMKELLETVLVHAHARTLVYVTITMAEYIGMLRDIELSPSKVPQSEMPLSLIIAMFDKVGLVPTGIEPIGFTSPMEAWEIIFITKMHRNDLWQETYSPESSDEEAPQGEQE